MKKMLFFVAALVSCALLFNSCEEKESKTEEEQKTHILDGYTYQTDDFWPEETWTFKNGAVTRYIYFGEEAIIKDETLKYEYKTDGSKLYIAIGINSFEEFIDLEDVYITGRISSDKSYIDLKSEYGEYKICRIK